MSTWNNACSLSSAGDPPIPKYPSSFPNWKGRHTEATPGARNFLPSKCSRWPRAWHLKSVADSLQLSHVRNRRSLRPLQFFCPEHSWLPSLIQDQSQCGSWNPFWQHLLDCHSELVQIPMDCLSFWASLSQEQQQGGWPSTFSLDIQSSEALGALGKFTSFWDKGLSDNKTNTL